MKVIKSKDSASWVEIEIFTGRKHQIRIHLNSIHHPVLGDPKYGKDNKNKTGLKLWATYLSFPHPFKKEVITQTLQPPENWLSEWNQL